MACSPECTWKYASKVANIVYLIWNSPLKDVIKDIIDESKETNEKYFLSS